MEGILKKRRGDKGGGECREDLKVKEKEFKGRDEI